MAILAASMKCLLLGLFLVTLVYAGTELFRKKMEPVKEETGELSRQKRTDGETELIRQKRIDTIDLSRQKRTEGDTESFRQKRLNFEEEAALQRLSRVSRDLDMELSKPEKQENAEDVELFRQKRV